MYRTIATACLDRENSDSSGSERDDDRSSDEDIYHDNATPTRTKIAKKSKTRPSVDVAPNMNSISRSEEKQHEDEGEITTNQGDGDGSSVLADNSNKISTTQITIGTNAHGHLCVS